MGRFDGKVLLLTGSAASVKGEQLGFGGETAWRFLEEGGHGVMLTDVQDDKGERAAAQMRDEGYNAAYMHLDVTNEDEWNSVVSETVSQFGGLHGLVNIAGTIDRGTIEDTSADHWQLVIDVSLRQVFLGTRASIEPMRTAGGGSIVNIASMVGRSSSLYAAGYSTSRAGMIQFAKAAAIQLGQVQHQGQRHTPRLDPYALHRVDLPGRRAAQDSRHTRPAWPLGRAARDCRGHPVPAIGRRQLRIRRRPGGRRRHHVRHGGPRPHCRPPQRLIPPPSYRGNPVSTVGRGGGHARHLQLATGRPYHTCITSCA